MKKLNLKKMFSSSVKHFKYCSVRYVTQKSFKADDKKQWKVWFNKKCILYK